MLFGQKTEPQFCIKITVQFWRREWDTVGSAARLRFAFACSLFAKKLPPAAFLLAKSPLRVRIPFILSQNKNHPLKVVSVLEERVGFEPTDGGTVTGFQDRLFRPLRHLSIYSQQEIL